MSRAPKIGKIGAVGGVIIWLTLALGMPFVASADATSTMRSNVGLEDIVRAYFADMPVMIPIAKCESRYRQFDTVGRALDGGSGAMMGLYQINAHVHAAYARSLGMDINTVEGNLAYAKKLYSEEGTAPWLASSSCWKKLIKKNSDGSIARTVATTAVTTFATTSPTSNATSTSGIPTVATTTLYSTLKLGVVRDEVKTLQELLNKTGFTIAQDGPGSAGQETGSYGAMTRSAVQKFQCAKQIVCDGDEFSTGFGSVGAKTRAALLATIIQ